ncbi:MAG TPA: hypothetical protein VJ866_03535 [Pyrinomonadaceae bacterium]|nr:hypothetical protein [Pyrinomonadaceae bacterium]
MNNSHRPGARDRRGERGAALVTTLLMSALLLSAGGALIITTTMSATTAVDSTAEMQAYYAAQAGLDAGLAVLRRNVPSNPSGTSADFRTVVCGAAANCVNNGGNLSTWLTADMRTLSSTNPATSFSLNVRDAAFAPGAPLPPSPYLPRFLLITSTGRGPKGAVKVLQMTVDAFSFEFTVRAAVAIRSHDTSTQAMSTFTIGNSDPHLWNGNDTAVTPQAPVPAFAVTNSADYDGGDGLNTGTLGKAEKAISEDGANVIGAQQLTKINPTDLETWLQTADNARAFLTQMRAEAVTQGRLNPTDFGSPDTPKFSFVDGDVTFNGSENGAGLLILTGKYTQGGSATYHGIILALGDGDVDRNGTPGIGGALVVAKFQHNWDGGTKSYTGAGGFLAPSVATSGGGNSLVGYNSDDVRRAMESLGCRVIGVVEK